VESNRHEGLYVLCDNGKGEVCDQGEKATAWLPRNALLFIASFVTGCPDASLSNVQVKCFSREWYQVEVRRSTAAA
jgi:hypothetical protein